MQLCLYEFVTSGGWYSCPKREMPESLRREGRAMLRALAADFAALPGAEVSVLVDQRSRDVELPGCRLVEVTSAAEEREALARLASQADWTVVIAPEFDGHLLDRCRFVESRGGRRLGPSSDVVALAADKHRLAEHLRCHGIAAPRGIALEPDAPPPCDFAYPAVLKPRDGAGSDGVRLVESAVHGRAASDAREPGRQYRLEEFVSGLACSVATLCGPRRIEALVPCRQLLDREGSFAYRGGTLPLERNLARRATQLALRAIGSLPPPLGYLGVDLVLGDDPTGSADVVIEINPRLTTSYVGLRAACAGNLAAGMLDVAEGRRSTLSWDDVPIQFDSYGRIQRWAVA
jgi:predicted ATP-grasp superfamily ATP-dependent carboligase